LCGSPPPEVKKKNSKKFKCRETKNGKGDRTRWAKWRGGGKHTTSAVLKIGKKLNSAPEGGPGGKGRQEAGKVWKRKRPTKT